MPRNRTIVVSLTVLLLAWLLWRRVIQRMVSTRDDEYAPRPFPFRPIPPTPPTVNEASYPAASTAETLRAETASSYDRGTPTAESERATPDTSNLTAATEQAATADTGTSASAVPDTAAGQSDTQAVNTTTTPDTDTMVHTEPKTAPTLFGPPPIDPEPDAASTVVAEPPTESEPTTAPASEPSAEAETVTAAGPVSASPAELELATAPASTPETAAEAEPEPAAASVSEAAAEAAPATTSAPASSTEAAPAVPATAAQPPAEEKPSKPDDLMLIEGIGPKISTIVMAAGITTFKQLAATDAARLKEILQEAGIQTSNPTTWPIQARLAAAGRWDALRELQHRIKNGRIET